MEGQQSLWAATNRPHKLHIVVERLWLAGEDVVSVTTTTRGTKTTDALWSTGQEFAGPSWAEVVPLVLENAVQRFNGPLWDREGRQASYEHWVATMLT